MRVRLTPADRAESEGQAAPLGLGDNTRPVISSEPAAERKGFLGETAFLV
jgi:hypothetical protein